MKTSVHSHTLLEMWISFVLLLSAVTPVTASAYIDYEEGELPIILGAPHGGALKPTEIQDRTDGCYVNSECVWTHDCGTTSSSKCGAKMLKDSYTQEITRAVADRLQVITGKRPYMVINLLHRSKLDANRDKPEATLGDSISESAWDEFQDNITQAKAAIGDRAVYFDFHGQTHSENWIELGYLVTRTRLNNDTPLPQYSSIKSLADNVTISFDDLLRGSNSFGELLQNSNYKTVPSPDYPGPGNGGYYSGGYNTRQHGSRYGGVVDAIQLEIPKIYRNSNEYQQFAVNLGTVIYDFMNLYYSL